MYDELIRRFRDKAARNKFEGNVELARDYTHAADAIEELSLVAESNERSAARWAETAGKAVEQIPRWIPVTERLPPYGDRILVTDKTGVWEGYLSYSRGFMRNTGMTIKDIYDVEVTHWMPLPEPPKEEE